MSATTEHKARCRRSPAGRPRATILTLHATLLGAGLSSLALIWHAHGGLPPMHRGELLAAVLLFLATWLAALLAYWRRMNHQKEALESLGALQLAAEGACDGLWCWDVTSDRLRLSKRAAAIMGLPSPHTRTILDSLSSVHECDLQHVLDDLREFSSGEATHLKTEFRLRGADDIRRVVLRATRRREPDGHVRVGGSFSDVTDWKRQEQQLTQNAFYDTLTGLPNRALFQERLRHTFIRLRRNPRQTFAVMFLDLDNFKNINDSLGHRVGDSLLMDIARRLSHNVRPNDTLARLGGDEFVLLVEDIEDPQQAHQVVDRVQKLFSAPFDVDGRTLTTSASIGIAICNASYTSPEDLLRDADTAMYRAKAKGKARHCLFVSEMRSEMLRRITLERDLQQAVEDNELALVFQPLVDLEHCQMRGFEVLVRWPEAKVGPDVFIPIAEETGLIIPMSLWILEASMDTLSAWRHRFPLHPDLWMHVNVSPQHFSEPGFAAHVLHMLEERSLPPAALRLEITETVMLERRGDAFRTFKELREAGIAVHIDDFGTGFSSLSYLHEFEADGLKIDRSFVSNLDGSQEPGIVKTILDLARHLHMEVTAEGIETAFQRDLLHSLGCEYAQGYFFSMPIPAQQMEDLLTLPQPVLPRPPASPWLETRTAPVVNEPTTAISPPA